MKTPSVIIIGAGIGGLAAALRLAHAGYEVTVLEAHNGPGGKMRTVPSAAGPIDAGPTVLTMKHVFEDLFADVGETLTDHITLQPLHTLARHYWDDGQTLDLMADIDASAEQIKQAFGIRAREEFMTFSDRARRLFSAFDAPMMQHPSPQPMTLAKCVLRQPKLVADMAPHQSLHTLLRNSFSDPKLVQLFGRYATYVGGSPFQSPAILSLIWHAEAAGVWSVKGGMHQIAQKIAALAEAKGATFHYDTPALRISQQGGRAAGVETPTGRICADAVIFNGDPRALQTGLLGDAITSAVPEVSVAPRSLSAHVHTFAATPKGISLAHHTVFFAQNERAEFEALSAGRTPDDATLYLCSQDHPETGTGRFEIIRNAPPDLSQSPKEIAECHAQTFQRLEAFGLTFDHAPSMDALTTPQDFATLFPGSLGSLYGRSPHGMMAAFKRPTARTQIKGLYLCGGGAHPGAGVPMATLSGRHAADAIMTDLTLTSRFRQTAMHGGMSTA